MSTMFSGEGPLLGAWCSVPSSYSVELLAQAGYDWLCIDTQHGMLGFRDVLAMLQAAAITRTPALVRVPSGEPAAIMKALDAGANGVLVPLVNTAAQARQAVDACRYPPMGSRSWGPARAQLLSQPYTASSANADVVCAVQIETTEAVANLDSILEVEGVDVALVGPSDLAVDLGLVPGLGPIEGVHAETLRTLVPRIRKHGVTAAIYCGSVAATLSFHEFGYTMLAASADALLLRQGASHALRTLRAEMAQTSS